jgi:hypothetical protein
MEGAGHDSAKLKLIPTEKPIKAGDYVCIRKKPGMLEAAMITATVRDCAPDGSNPLLWDVTVVPVCRIESLRDVVVVVMNPGK